MLPRSDFNPDARRRDGLRPDCKKCRARKQGPRSKEGQQARALGKELWTLRQLYSAPALADVLSRAYDEIQQIGASGADFDAQVSRVRTAIFTHGCRTVDEIVEETKLSRYAVDRAVKLLIEEKAVEPRDAYSLEVDSDEPGRPPVEYHPTDSPRGEVFSHILHRRAAEDDLL